MEITRAGSKPSGNGPVVGSPAPSASTRCSARQILHVSPARSSPSNRGRARLGTPIRSAKTLIVTAGCGWTQREGGLVEEIHPGDVVWFAPGERHWHGATATSTMSHIAIQEKLNGSPVDWMEQVTDEQFLARSAS